MNGELNEAVKRKIYCLGTFFTSRAKNEISVVTLNLERLN